MSIGEATPYPSTRKDFEFIARNRRTAWFGLLEACGRLLDAEAPLQRKRALENIKTYRDRLRALGVEAPEEQA